MTTATQIQKQRSAAPKRIGVDLFERIDISEANVDRKNSIIKNVKILGKSSPNKHGMDVEGTDYLPQAHNQARTLYEGLQVNIGHPNRSDPDAERNPNDRNGVLFNVKTIGGETFGDWKLIPSHPMTARLLDCASDPQLHNQFALSHNAKGYGTVRANRYQISELPKVRSVDVVCNGGTNRSLFESRDTTMKKKFKDLLEAALPTTKERFQPLLELYEDIGDMPMDPVAAPPADMPAADKPSTDYMAHLGEMVKAICMDDSMTPDQKSEKIMAAIKVMEETKEKPAEGPGEDDAAGAEAESKEAAECAGKTMDGKVDGKKATKKEIEKETTMESREKDLASKEALLKVRDLCESLQFNETPLQRKMMVPLSDAERKAFIKDQKSLKPVKAASTSPRTATDRGVNVQESVAAGSKSVDFSDTTEEARKKRAAYFKN